MIRLIRIVKLYKQAKLAQKKAQNLDLKTPKFLHRKSNAAMLSSPNISAKLGDKN